jgi:hypothetical protein
VLDFQSLRYDNLLESIGESHVLLDIPVLAEIVEEMMLSRYHITSGDDMCSEEALSFLSCTLSGSLQSLMKVSPKFRAEASGC